MILYNKENIITNKQIEKCIERYNKDLDIRNIKIAVSEKSSDIFRMEFLIPAYKVAYWLVHINCEGSYNHLSNIIFLNLYNLNGNIEDKKIYGIGTLIHEIKHMLGEDSEDSCDNESKAFLNKNSKFLKEVLNLKEEYTIEDF